MGASASTEASLQKYKVWTTQGACRFVCRRASGSLLEGLLLFLFPPNYLPTLCNAGQTDPKKMAVDEFLQDKAQIKALWKRTDPGGKGHASLADIDRVCSEVAEFKAMFRNKAPRLGRRQFLSVSGHGFDLGRCNTRGEDSARP